MKNKNDVTGWIFASQLMEHLGLKGGCAHTEKSIIFLTGKTIE
jgi:hypothetical protein